MTVCASLLKALLQRAETRGRDGHDLTPEEWVTNSVRVDAHSAKHSLGMSICAHLAILQLTVGSKLAVI